MASVRYIVHDLDAAIEFYTQALGFELQQRYGSAMAILTFGDLSLWIAGPMASASKPMPDGRRPEPGGWNRIVVEVDDLEVLVASLRERGTIFRNDILAGPGGRQILCEDPCGNAIELFQANR